MDGWTDGEGMKIMGNDFDLEEVYTVCVCVINLQFVVCPNGHVAQRQ